MTSLTSAAPDTFESRISGLLLATADGKDLLVDQSVTDMLRLVREELGMDVVFVAQRTGGRSLFQYVEAEPENRVIEKGQSKRLEHTLCQRVLDGRLPALIPNLTALHDTHDIPTLPFPIGAYINAVVRLHDGSIYGTLCCFSFEPRPALGQRELKRLQMAARLTGRLIDAARGRAGA